MTRIFDIEHELQRARPRNVRDEVPYPQGARVIAAPRFFGPTTAPHVSDVQVLGLPGAWRAVNLVANGLATMSPLKALNPDGSEQTPAPQVASRPNASLGSFTFWHQAIAVAMMRGNFVGLLADFDASGYPRQVVPLPPQLVHCRYDSDGYTIYDFMGTQYRSLDVVHVPAFLLPGDPWGIGGVELFRRGFGQALEQQYLAADTYARGSVPAGVIEVPIPDPSKDQTEEVADQWIERHGHGQRRPAVLPEGWKFTPLSWSPEDAQFLQSRQFTVSELAFMFGLDPTDLSASLGGGGSTLTYANIEDRQIARVTDAYGPWMRRFEEAWTDLLPGNAECKFVPERLLRTDTKTRAEVHAINVASGVETQEEARAIEGRGPAPVKELPPPEDIAK